MACLHVNTGRTEIAFHRAPAGLGSPALHGKEGAGGGGQISSSFFKLNKLSSGVSREIPGPGEETPCHLRLGWERE